MILAGILDTYGGLRVVVTDELGHQLRHDETAIVLPGPPVVTWNSIPALVRSVELALKEWITERRYGNAPHTLEAVAMYQLRCLEHTRRSLDLGAIVET